MCRQQRLDLEELPALPGTCPYGHDLTEFTHCAPWVPCGCFTAALAGTRAHLLVTCPLCSIWTDTAWQYPPHTPAPGHGRVTVLGDGWTVTDWRPDPALRLGRQPWHSWPG